MQKEKILSELYHGNLNPVTKAVVKGSEFQKLQCRLDDAVEKLTILLNESEQPIPFVVNEILPTGLTILAGLGKVGKSWLALWLSMQVAKGEKVWDFATDKGTTLFLAFEDNENRLQDRLFTLGDDAPANAHLCIEIAKMGGDLETRIRNFIIEHTDTKLIIIDTLQKVRTVGNESNYMNDYDDLSILKNIADEYKIAILLIHHLRKQKDSDVFNQITGSTGLQGATDSMLVLEQSKRGDKYAQLYCVGRDFPQREFELERGQDNIWNKISDSLSETTISDLNFVNAVAKVMFERENFSGSASELSTLLNQNSVDNFSNKVITKKLRNLRASIEKAGIAAKTRKSNGAKIIELHHIRVESVDENPVS